MECLLRVLVEQQDLLAPLLLGQQLHQATEGILIGWVLCPERAQQNFRLLTPVPAQIEVCQAVDAQAAVSLPCPSSHLGPVTVLVVRDERSLFERRGRLPHAQRTLHPSLSPRPRLPPLQSYHRHPHLA